MNNEQVSIEKVGAQSNKTKKIILINNSNSSIKSNEPPNIFENAWINQINVNKTNDCFDEFSKILKKKSESPIENNFDLNSNSNFYIFLLK